MDRRTILAFALILVVFATPMLFRASRRPQAVAPKDTVAATAPVSAPGASAASAPESAAPIGAAPVAAAPVAAAPVAAAPVAAAARVSGDTTAIDFGKAHYVFTSTGGAPQAVVLNAYRNLGPTTVTQQKATITSSKAASLPPDLLHYRIVRGADTIALDTIPFRLAHEGDVATFTSRGSVPIALRYQVPGDGYVAHVSGQIDGAAAGTPAQLLVDLPPTLRSQESDTLDDQRHLAYGYKLEREDVKSVLFTKLDPTLVRTDSGPMTWVATRNKYFLIALIAPSANQFVALRMQGGPRVGRTAPTANATAVLPIQGGRFGFDLYAGPQSWAQLRTVGHDLENVNPYGGWIPGVQPFAAVCMRVLLWIRQTFNVSYGWVLIIFGVAVRLLLWPLNQSAMRSSLKMQRIQPELAEVQKKYKNEPEKQREALVKLYQEHGMSPFSPIMGCLPMLLPMPVLFALFFVFQNTIEFRGVSFLWLPDLSLADPYYITPVLMGATMFVLSWIGMRAAPPNPQTKMMSYMMPAVMTAVLWRFASGLNLYYAVQNIAALPQQWMLTRERMKAAPSAPAPAPLRSRRATT